nr:hypothetical protein [uncultured Draconibacterium sp.]
MKIVVIGGQGTIGSAVANHFKKNTKLLPPAEVTEMCRLIWKVLNQ